MPLFIVDVVQLTFNVKDPAYGALGNGSTDDTTAIAAANTAANSAGGGIVYFPPGTYLTTNQTLYPKVYLLGAGIGATTIKLKNGANTDLFSAQTGSINLSAAANSGSVGTLLSFGIQSMTLDGNKANQSSGTSYPIRFYGYDFILRDLEILNGYTGGVLIDWNGGGFIGSPSVEMESIYENIKFHDNNGIGFQAGGPHDSRLSNILSFQNGSHNFHIAKNANGLMLVNCHSYLCPNTSGVCGILDEATSGTLYINCESEGSHVCNWAVMGESKSWIGGSIFATSADWTSAVGIQLGQIAGQTPFSGQINQSAGVTTAVACPGININTIINECRGGGINFVSESNSNIIVNIFQSSGSYVLGTPSATDFYIIRGSGLTADGTLAKSGGMQLMSGLLKILDSAGRLDFVVDSSSSGVSGFNVPGTIQIISQGTGYNTGGNTGIGLLVDPGGNAKIGLVIFPHSSSQSAPLLEIQNESFVGTFVVDKDGNTDISGYTAIGTGHNTGIMALIEPSADNKKGLVIFPHSSSQSVPLLDIQNASFADVFTVDKDGAMQLQGASTFLSGSGAPSNGVGTNGDYYFRSGTPGTANQRIYVKSAGSWVGIV